MFKVVSWGCDFQPCTAMVWDYLVVGLLLGLIDSCSVISVEAIAYNF
jgi:hypothetical protein